MKTIKLVYIIHSPVEKVWQALVDPKLIDAWGAGPAIMDDQVGSKFSLWGGDIHGTNKEVEEHERLVQEWYGGKWPKPSTVSITLMPDKDGTRIILNHEGIPDEDYKSINDGWDSYYFGAIKSFLESQTAERDFSNRL
ncbi:SRPBCC domain-containing protein [Candidatus Gottesmanbacteria bacterium]|nr:SRPBCC domain-containing protein [Candidatus Gottesmanbacteria bacterium]